MQPPRHALGALLLEQNHIEESIQVYLDDLEVYKDNIRSLIGLDECFPKFILKLSEENKSIQLENYENKIKEVKLLLSRAKEIAGMTIKASCFCKKLREQINFLYLIKA